MNKHKIEIALVRKVFLSASLGIASFSYGQTVQTQIKGRLLSSSQTPIPYANIDVSDNSGKLLDGAFTDENGYFTLDIKPGSYRFKISGVDFPTQSITGLASRDFNLTINTSLQSNTNVPASKNSDEKVIKEVVIQAPTTRPYKVELDKKTYNVSQDIVNKGGNLQDILSNVPSVSVDTDGTVSMRGNSNVRFLVNGKPSALLGFGDGPSAMQAIPADQIERIEVITNPSSKFEASGTAGILNIILKKEKKKGFYGSVQGSLGYLPMTSLNTNLGWRKGALSWFLNGGGSYREMTRIRDENRTYNNPSLLNPRTTSITDSDYKSIGKSYNASSGFVYDISDNTNVNASITARYSESDASGGLTYTDSFINAVTTKSKRDEDGAGSEKALQGDFGMEHKFKDKGHQISGSLIVSKNDSESNRTFHEYLSGNLTDLSFENRSDTNSGIVGKIDYELPIGDQAKLEAGYRYDHNKSKAENKAGIQNLLQGGAIYPGAFNYTSDYSETFNAIYAQFKSKFKKIGYQIGARAENTGIDLEYKSLDPNTNVLKNKNYWGVFPTLFLSYEIGENQQILANYSRRLDRPRSWFLRPNASIQDIRSIFRGNPDLNPSYTDSFELGYSYQKKSLTINPTLYYRNQTDDVKMVIARENQTSNVTYMFPLNLGTEATYGLDFNFNIEATRWLRFLGNLDIFGYNTKGEYSYNTINSLGIPVNNSIDYTGNGVSTNARLSSTIKLDKSLSFQLQGDFRGGRKTANQTRKPIFGLNFGLNKSIWDGNGSITFNVQDVFNSRKRTTTTTTGDITTQTVMQMMPRMASVSLTYRFRQGDVKENVKPKRQQEYRTDDSDM